MTLTLILGLVVIVLLYAYYYYSKDENLQKEVDNILKREAQNEIPLHMRLNNKQKIFVLIGVGSLFLFLISIFGLGFGYIEVWGKWEMKSIFNEYGKINYIGIIAIVSTVVCITGFFIFKNE